MESYALDAVDWFDPDKEHKALKSEVTQFMNDSREAQFETNPSVGLGTDYRMESRKLKGFTPTHGGEILHLCIFSRENEQKESQEIYARRKSRVEHPFGHIKRNLKTDAFLMRGRDGVQTETSLVARCFNLSGIHWTKGFPHLKQPKSMAVPSP